MKANAKNKSVLFWIVALAALGASCGKEDPSVNITSLNGVWMTDCVSNARARLTFSGGSVLIETLVYSSSTCATQTASTSTRYAMGLGGDSSAVPQATNIDLTVVDQTTCGTTCTTSTALSSQRSLGIYKIDQGRTLYVSFSTVKANPPETDRPTVLSTSGMTKQP